MNELFNNLNFDSVKSFLNTDMLGIGAKLIAGKMTLDDLATQFLPISFTIKLEDLQLNPSLKKLLSGYVPKKDEKATITIMLMKKDGRTVFALLADIEGLNKMEQQERNNQLETGKMLGP